MAAHVNISGTWKEITDIQVNVSGVWKRVSFAYVNVSGVWKKFFQSILLDTTITVGSDANSVGYTGSIGSIADNNYVDRASNTMTIDQMRWDIATGNLVLIMTSGSAPANSDDTFELITINGNTFTRASASYGSGGSTSSWTWAAVSVPFSGVGNVDPFLVL